jgi:hypothetical protein
MSEVKVNKISPRTNCGTTTLGDSGDSFVIPSGVTITNNGTQTGFGRSGSVNWDTTAKTAGFTGVSGNGYFINTTSGAITVNLPASPSAGDIMALIDYAGTADTNNITVGRNGSNINGAASDETISKENSGGTFVYVDGTQGWKLTETANISDIALQPAFITASGGNTVATSGDYKIHTFTGPGTFTVCSVGNPLGSDTVDYLVVAAGGGGGTQGGGGGGAGGLRFSSCTYTAPPTSAPRKGTALPVSAQAYPVTINGGGAGASGTPGGAAGPGTSGGTSVFSTITSTGGGGGGMSDYTSGSPTNALTGGSGGGRGKNNNGSGGAGNTPPVSPSQGNNGGATLSTPAGGTGSGGGGGAGAVGGCGSGPETGPTQAQFNGNGGVGLEINITGSNTFYAGGGGGGSDVAPNPAPPNPVYGGLGGNGGGGNGALMGGNSSNDGQAGTANTGGGGGGAELGGPGPTDNDGGNGGSGIVIIRYKYQ